MSIGQILLVVLANSSFFLFIQFLITRKDNRNKVLNKLLAQAEKGEKDNCRTQLLLLISDYPNEVQEIMILAHHYFVELRGNWYASSIFKRYLKDHNIESPEWFSGSIKGETHDTRTA